VREAPGGHGQTEQLEKPLGHTEHRHVLGCAVRPEKREVVRLQPGRLHEGDARLIQPPDLAIREHPRRDAAVGQRRADVVEVFGAWVRERLQQHGIERAEDRRRGADAKRERRNGGQRKRGRAPKAAYRETNVL
jgi:hypothetical protein